MNEIERIEKWFYLSNSIVFHVKQEIQILN